MIREEMTELKNCKQENILNKFITINYLKYSDMFLFLLHFGITPKVNWIKKETNIIEC